MQNHENITGLMKRKEPASSDADILFTNIYIYIYWCHFYSCLINSPITISLMEIGRCLEEFSVHYIDPLSTLEDSIHPAKICEIFISTTAVDMDVDKSKGV